MSISIKDKYHKKTSATEHQAKIESSQSCISKIFEVSIDSTQMPSLNYVFYQHPNAGEQGLFTGININELKTGKHQLIIKIKHLDDDNIEIGETITIPFFKN